MPADSAAAWRNTSQPLAPVQHTPAPPGAYDLYPAHDLPPGQIEAGFAALAARLAGQSCVVLDGMPGVLWEHLRQSLDAHLRALGVQAAWQDVSAALRPAPEIDRLIAPFLGGDDPLFGMRFTGSLGDFFDAGRLSALRPVSGAALNIVYGTGAALAGWPGELVFVETPKNELQYRARAGSIANLGADRPAAAKAMYKRMYFVDWPALRQHSAALLPRIGLVIDAQRPETPVMAEGGLVRAALERMSQTVFRARPWFEPGPWGGQWIGRHIPQLPQDVPNYAWSFELITPENGLLLRSDGLLLEVPFDWLMFQAHSAVLGASASRFGDEFPIRFDFLDTVQGGNLSVQCHPAPAYALAHFGERFTQDETYYILDAEPGAQVFLGFREGVTPEAFRAALEESYASATPLDVERFVNAFPAGTGDLFLIPHGTVHCAGAGSLVLEISATPYIFTFKMYDWMRLDLDGRPRPLNIARAFDNLDFTRSGEHARRTLISRPAVIAQGEGWQVVHLPTHPDHFYDVHRLEFSGSIDVETDGSCHVLSLVEGDQVLLETDTGAAQRFSFAETFVVPAAARRYRLTSASGRPLKVIKGFMKP